MWKWFESLSNIKTCENWLHATDYCDERISRYWLNHLKTNWSEDDRNFSNSLAFWKRLALLLFGEQSDFNILFHMGIEYALFVLKFNMLQNENNDENKSDCVWLKQAIVIVKTNASYRGRSTHNHQHFCLYIKHRAIVIY